MILLNFDNGHSCFHFESLNIYGVLRIALKPGLPHPDLSGLQEKIWVRNALARGYDDYQITNMS